MSCRKWSRETTGRCSGSHGPEHKHRAIALVAVALANASFRGCIVGPDIAVLSLVVVKQGESEIPGLTDTVLPKRLGPKRATKIRRFSNLTKEDDVRQYVVRREVKSQKNPDKKPYTKA